MTIPFIDFRRTRGPSVGQQVVSAGLEGLIADAFRKRAEKRAEERTIAAEARASVRGRAQQRFGMELSLEQAQRAQEQESQFALQNAIETGQLVPETDLAPEELTELQSIGAQPTTVQGVNYYAAGARTQATAVDPNLVEPLNALMAGVGLQGRISPSGTTPEGIVSQANVEQLSPLLQNLRSLAEARIGKSAAQAPLLNLITGEPDLEKWAGTMVRSEDGTVRPLTYSEMVGLDKMANYEVLSKEFANPWYSQRYAELQGLEGNLERAPYADPAVINQTVSTLRTAKASEPTMWSMIRQAWTIGDEGLLWEIRGDKDPKPIRDEGKAAVALNGNPALMEALMYQMFYPNADALLAAKAARYPMPSAAVLGYLQHIWRLTGQNYELPPDMEVLTGIPEREIYLNMSPRAMDVRGVMDPDYRQQIGEVPTPITGAPSDPTASTESVSAPAAGQLATPAGGQGARPAPVAPTINVDPSEVNYTQAYTTAYQAIASDSARYQQMVDSLSAIYASPESALEYYQTVSANSADSSRTQRMKEMLESGDPQQIAWAKEALKWDFSYTMQMLRQAREDYLAKNRQQTTGSIPRIVP